MYSRISAGRWRGFREAGVKYALARDHRSGFQICGPSRRKDPAHGHLLNRGDLCQRSPATGHFLGDFALEVENFVAFRLQRRFPRFNSGERRVDLCEDRRRNL